MVGLSLGLPEGAQAAAIVFPPWWTASRTLSAIAFADATIVRSGGLPAILIVRPSADQGLRQLRRAGALLIVNPIALGWCQGN